MAERAKQQLQPSLGVLEQRLAGREFIVGEAFSVADVLIASTLSWGGSMGLLEGFPGLRAYTSRLLERPAAKRAYAD